MMALFAAVGGILFGVMNGQLYGVYANDQGKCFGEKCFKTSFIISGSICGVVFVTSGFVYFFFVLFFFFSFSLVWLSWRTRTNVALYQETEEIDECESEETTLETTTTTISRKLL